MPTFAVIIKLLIVVLMGLSNSCAAALDDLQPTSSTNDDDLMASAARATKWPTRSRTSIPRTMSPSRVLTPFPSTAPSKQRPTKRPTTHKPTRTNSPTTHKPTRTNSPTTHKPTRPTTRAPSRAPVSSKPSKVPSGMPSSSPSTSFPSSAPRTSLPSRIPSHSPSRIPTVSKPSAHPSAGPTVSSPSKHPSRHPSTSRPSISPRTSRPSKVPSQHPIVVTTPPSRAPSHAPVTSLPSRSPTARPSAHPLTSAPSLAPTQRPTAITRTGLVISRTTYNGTFNYCADPNALAVAETLYVFCSHDPPDADSGTKYTQMREYVLLTTTSVESGLEQWVNHGVILRPVSDFPSSWNVLNSKLMFAPGVIYKSPYFYLYFPYLRNQDGEADVGVARSRTPHLRGTWELLVAPIPRAKIFDPSVMIGPTGRAFIYGSSHTEAGAPIKHFMIGAELQADMFTLKAQPVQIYGGFVTEAVFAFWRRNDAGAVVYYFMARVQKPPQLDFIMYWMTSDPMQRFPNIGANRLTPNQFDSPPHVSIVEFRRKWYLFYHTGAENNGNRWRRTACFEEIKFHPDGKMDTVAFTCKYSP